jgi:hypothetical protein
MSAEPGIPKVRWFEKPVPRKPRREARGWYEVSIGRP